MHNYKNGSPNHPHREAGHLQVSGDILQKFGVIDELEAEAVETCIRNAYAYGNEALHNGLANMFDGMAQAVQIYTEMKIEIHNLHEGILALRDERSAANDRRAAEETTRLLEAQVLAFTAPKHAATV